MKTLIVLAVLCLFVVNDVRAQNNITAQRIFGIEMIELDSPSWLTHIQVSHYKGELLLFGERTLRPITTADQLSGFVALPSITDWSYDLLDLHTFFAPNTNPPQPWTFGVTDYDVDMDIRWQGIHGPYLPVIVMKPTSNTQYLQQSFTGLMLAGLRVDERNMSDVLSYYAGWIVNYTDPSDVAVYGKSVSFGIVRTHFNASQTGGGLNVAQFKYDPILDVGNFYQEKFASFSPTFKPFVHVLPNQGIHNNTLVVVADPNTRAVYHGFFEETGFVVRDSVQIKLPGYDLVSTALGFFDQVLYVGLAVSGNASTGVIAIIKLYGTSLEPTFINLPEYCNNPRALALDEPNNILYVGLNGGSEVLRINLKDNTVSGYQRLPDWLHQTWDGIVGPVHLYFITYEQHSKVFRVSKDDFCPTRCPYWGYCSKGACTCSEWFTLSADKKTCELTQLLRDEDDYAKVHQAEVALGVMFTLSTIVAGAGWFMWFRNRRNSYQAV